MSDGFFDSSNAAEPETMGAAPEVPPNASSPVPVPAIAETDAPGAPISGLIAAKLVDGPREEVPTIQPLRDWAAASEIVTFTVEPAAICARIEFATACVTTSVGAQLLPSGLHSPPFENDTASPAATRPSITAVAPAAVALLTFWLIAQLPRLISATLPARLAGRAWPLQASVVTDTTSPVTLRPSTGAHSTVAVLVYEPAMAAGALTMSGYALALGTSVCATLSTSGVEAGEPVMNGRSALLPAEATTTMPASTAFALASDRSSWIWP